MDRATLAAWIDAYEGLWRTPGTDRLGELFAPDATYSMGPFEETQRGLPAIAELWERERVGPDEPFRMSYEIVAVEQDTGVSRVEVAYDGPPPRHYKDIWIVRLDEGGRCAHFEEWPFWPEQGTYAPGAVGRAG